MIDTVAPDTSLTNYVYNEFDSSRAILRGPDMFPRMPMDDAGVPLSSLKLAKDAELFVVERNSEQLAFPKGEFGFWHTAQGVLGGENYLIAFCAACNTAIGLTPIVNDEVLHFSLGGVYNAKMLMVDDETRSYWDYVTGRAVHGQLKGEQIPLWNVTTTSAGVAAEQYPNLIIHTQRLPLWGKVIAFTGRYLSHWMPPGFRSTLGKLDKRRSKMELGLGIATPEEQWFVPLSTAVKSPTFDLHGRPMRVTQTTDGHPVAKFGDGEIPLQYLTRWYAFSSTFPACQVL